MTLTSARVRDVKGVKVAKASCSSSSSSSSSSSFGRRRRRRRERQDAVGAFRPPTASLGLQVEVKRREERGRGRGREVLRALGTVGVSAAVVTDTVDQVAFRELVTVDSVAEATEVFARWGIVCVRNFLSEGEVEELLQGAAKYGVRRNAFGQTSQLDRYTLWIAGDGMSEEQERDVTNAMKASVPCLNRAIFRDCEGSWREITDKFGYPNLMLAEQVTSQPGGAPQDWHFDGEGVTAQISLVPIGGLNGPTEIQPRPSPHTYMHWANRLGANPPMPGDETMMAMKQLTDEVKMMYDRLTKVRKVKTRPRAEKERKEDSFLLLS